MNITIYQFIGSILGIIGTLFIILRFVWNRMDNIDKGVTSLEVKVSTEVSKLHDKIEEERKDRVNIQLCKVHHADLGIHITEIKNSLKIIPDIQVAIAEIKIDVTNIRKTCNNNACQPSNKPSGRQSKD